MKSPDEIAVANWCVGQQEIGEAQQLIGRVQAQGPGERSDAACGRIGVLLRSAAARYTRMATPADGEPVPVPEIGDAVEHPSIDPDQVKP